MKSSIIQTVLETDNETESKVQKKTNIILMIFLATLSQLPQLYY